MAKIIVRGPALSQSNYGEYCREVLRALKDSEHDLYLMNIGWGESGWIFEDNEERRWIDSLIIKTSQVKEPEFDLSVQVQLPVEWQSIASKNIGVTFGVETTEAPESWKQACQSVDAVITPSSHSANSLTLEGSENNIHVIGYAQTSANKKAKALDMNLATENNFLSVAQWSPRSNVEQTISSFVQEFMLEDVGLIMNLSLKGGSYIDRFYTLDRIKTFLGAAPPTMKCKVYLLHGSLTSQELDSLYNDNRIIGYVSSSHGDGFDSFAYKAACSGVPLIAPNWGGTVEFSSTEDETLINEVKYTPSELEEWHQTSGVLEQGKWCYPDTVSLREQFRNVYSNTKQTKTQANKLKKHLVKKFANKSVKSEYNNIINSVLSDKGENNEA